MPRYFYHDDQTTVKFLATYPERVVINIYRCELGNVAHRQDQREMSADEIAMQVQQARQYGFVELEEAVWLAKQQSIAAELQQRSADPIDDSATCMPWEQLAGHYGKYLANDPAQYLTENLRKFCCFDQPVERSGDVVLSFDSLGATAQTAQRNLIFQQGLRINGNLDAAGSTSELPLFVLVQGDLHCDNLLLSGWAEVVVTGDVYVSGLILGFDGETGGRLKVHGQVTAGRIMGGFMCPIEIDGQVRADVYWLEPDQPTLPNSQSVASEFSEVDWQNRQRHTPLVDEAYHAERNWATGQEVVTYHFCFEYVTQLVRTKARLFR